MKKPKRQQTKRCRAADKGDAAPPSDVETGAAPAYEPQVTVSNQSLHQLFQQQARDMLDRTDLDEEQKASILVAMSCPCCGAGGPSFTAPLKRRS